MAKFHDATAKEAQALIEAVHGNNPPEVVQLVCDPSINWQPAFAALSEDDVDFVSASLADQGIH